MVLTECNENAVRILIGNKIDLKDKRAFNMYEGHQIAEKFGLDRYVETSAQHNIEVTSTIYDILVKIERRKLKRKTPESSINISIRSSLSS